MRGIQLALGTSPFAHVENSLRWLAHSSFKRQHDQRAKVYNQDLAQEPENSGGPEAKDGDNTVHQIVPAS